MLDPQEKLAFDGLVTRLRSEDPRFTRQLDRMGRPPRPMRATAAVLLWTATPVCVLAGGWPGVVLGALAAGYGTRLFATRRATAPEPEFWSARYFQRSPVSRS